MTTQGAADSIGIVPIIVQMPCKTCFHPHGKHSEVPGSNIRGKCTDTFTVSETEIPCPCEDFEGGFPDGSPRSLKLRQLTGMEFAEIKGGYPGALILSAEPEIMTDEERARAWQWSRDVICRAVTHCLTWNEQNGVPVWHRMRVVAENIQTDDPWDLPINVLDQANSANVGILTAAVISNLRGLPEGVEVLQRGDRFRPGDNGPVLRDGAGVREDATRTSKRKTRRPRRTDGA